MNIAQIRRDALALGIRTVRLPLSAAEAILKKGQDTTDWPPTLAFERTEAAVTKLIGNVVNDPTLVASSRLQQAEAAQREQAAAKQAEAEEKRLESRRQADETVSQLTAEAQDIERTARERQRRLAEERREAEQKIEQTAASKRSANRRRAAAQTDTIKTVEAQAEAVRLREEAEALRLKEQVVDAKDEVLHLDREVRAKKASRRNG